MKNLAKYKEVFIQSLSIDKKFSEKIKYNDIRGIQLAI